MWASPCGWLLQQVAGANSSPGRAGAWEGSSQSRNHHPGGWNHHPGGPDCASSQPPLLGEAPRDFNCSEHLHPTSLSPFKLSLVPPAPPCPSPSHLALTMTCPIPVTRCCPAACAEGKASPGRAVPPHSRHRWSLSFSKAPHWLPDLMGQWGQSSSTSPGNPAEPGVVLGEGTENPPGCFPGLAKIQAGFFGGKG